jgi:purine-binding chemotaxis protein CheW
MRMSTLDQMVTFTINEQRYGIPLEVVERVVRMVEITPLPTGPDFIHGVINVKGEILPVVNLRRRFSLPERPVEISDQLIIIRCATRSFVLMSDMSCEVLEFSELMQTEASGIIPDLPFLSGVVKLPNDLILLQDPEMLLSPGESKTIEEIIGSEQS